jgi:hypothetical protein
VHGSANGSGEVQLVDDTIYVLHIAGHTIGVADVSTVAAALAFIGIKGDDAVRKRDGVGETLGCAFSAALAFFRMERDLD